MKINMDCVLAPHIFRSYTTFKKILHRFGTFHYTSADKKADDGCLHASNIKKKQKDRKMKEVTIKVLVRKLYESLSEQISAVI